MACITRLRSSLFCANIFTTLQKHQPTTAFALKNRIAEKKSRYNHRVISPMRGMHPNWLLAGNVTPVKVSFECPNSSFVISHHVWEFPVPFVRPVHFTSYGYVIKSAPVLPAYKMRKIVDRRTWQQVHLAYLKKIPEEIVRLENSWSEYS